MIVNVSSGLGSFGVVTDPERFEAKPVRTEPFDATRLVIRAGIGAGERIVVRGAEHLNQIR